MARPKKIDPRGRAAFARLSEREWDLFDRLTEDREGEVRRAAGDSSIAISQSDVIRWLIVREAVARGLDRDAVSQSVAESRSYPPIAPEPILQAAERTVDYGEGQAPPKKRKR